MKICDSHVHSEFSFDGSCTVEELCESAAAKGLFSITITDHCEVDFLHTTESEYGDMKTNIPLSAAASGRAKEEFKGKIKVLTGIELGQPLSDISQREEILSKGSFDFVLASLHSLEGMEDFYYLKYDRDNVKIYLDKYFRQLLEISKWDGFDSLAHLTYPLRYMYAQLGEMPDLSDYYHLIDEIFANLVKNKKALEINVGGCRSAVKAPQPDWELVSRFKRAGGKYITFGSDAHDTKALGMYMDRAREVALRAGFNSYFYYVNRQPAEAEL